MTEMKRTLQIVTTGLVVVAGSLISIAARAESPEFQNAPLTTKERHAVVEEIVTKLNALYIFPALARTAGDSVRRREEEGAYNQLTTIEAFANALTQDLQEVTHDKH